MTRIPSVLKWLLVRRARLLGEIQKTEKRLRGREASLVDELAQLEPRVATLKARLDRIQALGQQHIALLKSRPAALTEKVLSSMEIGDRQKARPKPKAKPKRASPLPSADR